MYAEKVLSGMRPTGALHLGHYHGVLKNWIELQHEYPCLFFVADWHALTTHYDDPRVIEASVWDMVIDWLAAGVDPQQATIFIQSRVPEHAELHLLLSMMTPLGWLERVPTYKDQQEKLEHKDLSTYGFLGYPLLQAADILIYRADKVPVGEDQVPHIEFSREIARRFNHLYGRETGFEEKAREAVKKLGSKKARLYDELRTRFQEQGDETAIERAHALLDEVQHLSVADRERLFGYLEGTGKMILVEPESLLTKASRMPGLDGQKMSKSYSNTISLREDEASVTQKVRRMPTDPARVRRTDVGDPEKCPVWQLHQVYSDDATLNWVQQGCRSAGIGCLDCKQPVIDGILKEQAPMRERAQVYLDDPTLVRNIVADGCEKARKLAHETMRDVREAMGLSMADAMITRSETPKRGFDKPSGAEIEAELLAMIHDVFANRIPFNKVLGLDIVSLTADKPILRFDMRPELVGNFFHGILHGGVTSAVLDVTGGIVAFLGLQKKLVDATIEERLERFSKIGTIDLRIDYLRPGKGTSFTATGFSLRTGNKVAVARMELHNDSGDLIAVGTGAYLIG